MNGEMTIQDVLDRTNEMKRSLMDDGKKIKYISEIEQLVWRELLMKHEHTEEEAVMPCYDESTDTGTVLIVPESYGMVYVYWLMTKIDQMNLEFDKYNTDRVFFDNAWDILSDWMTRERMPISTEREFRL